MKINKCSIAVLLVLELVFYPALAEEVKETGPATEQHKLSDKQKILLSATSFRSSVLNNYKASLDKYASIKIKSWFKSIDDEWWQVIPGGMVWQRLMLDAQMLYTNISNNPLVLYYSVWSDIYLITEWKVMEGEAKIIDAEIVSGDFFRLSQDDEVHSTPLWSRSSPYLLNAITESIVVSLNKANEVFLKSEDMNWRGVGGLEDPLNNNRLLASKSIAKNNILSNFYNIMRFNGDDETKISSIRFNIYYLLASVSSGRLDEFLAGENTSLNNAVKDYLQIVKDIKKVGIVAHVEIKEGSWVFIVFSESPYIVLAVLLNKDANGSHKISQIEAINYAGAYNYGY